MNAGVARSVAASFSTPGAGPEIGRRAAQQLARRELARSSYQESTAARIEHWIGRLLARIFAAGGSVPGGWWATVVMLVVLVGVITLISFWIRPARPVRGARHAVLSGRLLSAADHRNLAEASAADGDYSTATIERLRAIAVELEERGILPAQPGRTADELATQAAAARPELAPQLSGAARTFDEVRYGGRAGTAAGYRQVSDLDVQLRTMRAGTAAMASAAADGRS